jgi:hypothetical protein
MQSKKRTAKIKKDGRKRMVEEKEGEGGGRGG